MSWLFTVFILSLAFTNNLSEAEHLKKLPSAVVVGTVYCDTCFQQDFSKTSHFIQGALVAVECDANSKPTFRKEVKTDEHGEFKVNLPFSVSKHVKKIEGCSVKLIRSSEPYCSVASTATSSSLHLKSRKPGTHIFSAGFFTFKPLKQPDVCNQKPSLQKPNSLEPLVPNPNVPTTLPTPIQDPSIPTLPTPTLPPLPQIPPLPQLPPLPHLPPLLPFPPPLTKELSDEKTFGIPNPFQPPSLFPPNPFQPPPSLIPPIFPSPPPSLFPPIFPSPSPPPSLFPPINFPPLVPGLVPSPPPAFPIPLPPLPFLPSPLFPGVPPRAGSSKKTSP